MIIAANILYAVACWYVKRGAFKTGDIGQKLYEQLKDRKEHQNKAMHAGWTMLLGYAIGAGAFIGMIYFAHMALKGMGL